MLSCPKAPKRSQRGVALLIAIFVLVMISAIAISLILMAGMESGINANYRSTTRAFYAAQSGIEEARERMVVNAPDTIRNLAAFPNATPPNIVPGQVLYILNPAPGDPAFNPQSDPPTSPYYDHEYQSEFGVAPVPNPLQVTNSSAMTTAGGQAPLPYKWVRINLKSEAMGGVDLDQNGILDPTTPVQVQGSNNECLPTMPNCTVNAVISSKPIYRLTSFSLEPTGGTRMLQAEVAEEPIINPNGAISSQAGVTIHGNFNALGAWPPLASAKCSGSTVTTCGTFTNGNVAADCKNLYVPLTDMCCDQTTNPPTCTPRSHNDYCNQAPGIDSVASAGSISTSGTYSEVPDTNSSCSSTGSGCIFTVSPNKALDPNISNWPYNMDQIIQMLSPPVTEPITDFSGVTCTAFDQYGNRTCSGQSMVMGTLPSPWIPPPNTTSYNNVPKFVFADVGRSGLLKLTGGSSGSGLLVVDGDLALEGGFQWFGLIVVRGTVDFLGGGSTGTNVVGGVIAGNDVTNANTTSGGSVSVFYSSCAYRPNNNNMALRYLSFREITCRTNAGVTTCQ